MDTTVQSERLIGSGNVWLPEGASTIAPYVDGPFWFVFWVSLAFFIIIMATLTVFLVKYRKSSSNPKATKHITHNIKLEIIWAGIPLLFLLGFFTWGFIGYLKMSVAPANAIEVRVTAQKWFWQFEYPELGSPVIGELTVPVNTPVKLIMASTDVLHSFYVPHFRVKKDVIPNRYSTLWFEAERTGIFQIFCTEYCGDGHSDMLGVVRVVSESEYENWLTEANMIDTTLPPAQIGELVYNKKACFTCHSIDGSVKTGPTWQGLWNTTRNFTDGTTAVVDDNYIRSSIVNPGKQIVAGYQNVMPTYQGILSEREITGIIEYIKTLQ